MRHRLNVLRLRGTVHSRQGWSGEGGRNSCTVATVFREKPAFTARLLPELLRSEGAHTLQSCLLHLDSLQTAKALGVR